MKTCHLNRVMSRKRSATTATSPATAMSALSVIIRPPPLAPCPFPQVTGATTKYPTAYEGVPATSMG